MSFPLFLQGVGSIGVFASRAFPPAFVTALLLRFGPEVPGLARLGLLPEVRGVPTWFTSDLALVVLGILAALELAAERFPEARALLDEAHGALKTGMAMLTFLGVMNATDRAAVGPMLRPAGALDFLPVLAVGAGVALASQARRTLLSPLGEADEDDDLGVRGLFGWVEDLWAGLGPVALVLFPILAVGAFGLAVGLLVWVERVVVSRAGSSEVPCAHCGRMIHAGALACPACQGVNESPRSVGLLGRAKSGPADPATQPFRLVAAKRCPRCATRFGRRAVRQDCGACGHRLMDDPEFARAYIGFIDRRVPLTCVVALALGLIPVLGVIPGVIAYRLAIVAPFRRYIPPGRGMLLRWGVRVAVVVLVALQWIPVAGGLAVPTMGLITYGAYRSAYRKFALAP